MRTTWALLLGLVFLGAAVGCGGPAVEAPEDPVPPPEGDPESSSDAAVAPD
ncbi:MAG: hypothetical protein ACYTG0_25820 [Planctomycetota bacterium]